jgi:hypothetical protein
MVWLVVLYAALGVTFIHGDPPWGFRGESSSTGRLVHLGVFLYVGRAWPWPFYVAYAACALAMWFLPYPLSRPETNRALRIATQAVLLATCLGLVLWQRR